jgi:hypothetical protein
MYFDKADMNRLVLISSVSLTLFTSAMADTIRSDGSITESQALRSTVSSAQAGKPAKIVKPAVTPSTSVSPVVIVPGSQNAPAPAPASSSGK